MADREININAKIANLQKIKEELEKINVGLKIDNKEFDKLLELSKKGITIPVRLELPPEFKQLIELQKKGITIKGGLTNTTRLPSVTSQAPAPVAEAAARTAKQVALERAAEVSRRDEAEFRKRVNEQHAKNVENDRLLQEERARNERKLIAYQQAQIQERKAQARINRILPKANQYVTDNPIEALFGQDYRGNAAAKFGIPKSSITASPSFFDLGRLRNKDNLQQILFTTLLGGTGQGIGAALGAATLNKEGILPGATAAAALIETFNRIKDSMLAAAQAGLEYERAVTGITGVFQATSEVVSTSGRPVGIKEQLDFQGRRAEGIQGAAQRALVPLGITGKTQSALVQSFVAGLAQRGLAPDEKSTETLLRRFGAAIQTLQPELASDPTLIRRGFEDIIGGGPQATRTELGSAIKKLTPQLFGSGIRSLDDIDKATVSLEKMAEAIRNSDKASIQLQRSIGALQLAEQEVGRGLLEGVAPALKALADELTKPELTDGLKELGTAIGQAAGDIIGVLIPAIKGLSQAAKSGVQTSGGLVKAGVQSVGAVTSFVAGNYQGVSDNIGGALGTLGSLLTRRQINITGDKTNPLLDNLSGQASGGQTTALGNAFTNFINARRQSQGLPPLSAGGTASDLKARPSLQQLFASAQTDFGVQAPGALADDAIRNSPEFKLRGISQLREKLKDYAAGRDPNEVSRENIGLSLQELQLRQQQDQERANLFGSGDAGQLGRTRFERGANTKRLGEAQAILEERRAILGRTLVNIDSKESDVAKAREEVVAAEKAVTEMRLKNTELGTAIAEKEDSLLRKRLQNIDTFSFSGQERFNREEGVVNAKNITNLNNIIASQQAILNNPRASAIDKQNAQDAISDAQDKLGATNKNEADRLRRVQLEPLNRAQGRLDQIRSGERAKDAAQEAALDLRALGISTKELTLRQNDLSRSLADSKNALSDFSAETKLRSLGRKGQEIAAAEKIVAAGGAVPAGVDAALVRGSDYFDEFQRQQFDQEVAREEFDQVSRRNLRGLSDDSRTRQRLEDEVKKGELGLESSAIEQERQGLKENQIKRTARDAEFNNLSDTIRSAQLYPEDKKLQEAAEAAKKRLPELLKEQSEAALTAPQAPPSTIKQGKRGTFTINGETVLPTSVPEGINISDAGNYPELIADNSIGSALLGGIGGSGAYARAKSSSEKGTQAAVDILQGLGKDAAGRLKEDKERGDRGNSVFDDLTALKPLTQSETRDAFIEALNSAFV